MKQHHAPGRAASRSARLAAPLTAGLLALFCASAPASAAGFFESLFGVRSRPQAVYAPRPVQNVPLVAPVYADPSQRARAAAKTKANAKAKAVAARPAVRARAEASPVRAMNARPQVLAGPLGPFLLDSTLRRGDVVVTTQGLKVFTGVASGQHSTNEFASLAQASQLVQGNFRVLAAIDRANRFSDTPLVTVQAVPVAAAAKPAEQAAKPARRAAL